MVYSPGIVLIRDDNGEWRSPVEVDVLTSAAVNAGEIRRGLEREERLRKERVEMEFWKRRGEQRRRENEKAMAERQRLREAAKNKKLKEEIAKLKKEQASLVKLQKERVKEDEADKGKAKDSGSEKEEPSKKEQASLVKLQKERVKENETDKGKAKDSGSEKEEPFDEQGKAAVEVENANEENEENEKGGEVEVENPEENQENPVDSPDNGLESGSDTQLKGAEEENTESKGTLISDDRPLPEAPLEVDQEPTSSSTIVHPLSPQTQPSQAPDPNPKLTYALALENAEIQIEQAMYARISRILHLFQLHQTPHLILGSFGTGVFKNRIDLIANIFADLLIKPGGRFKDVFQTVVFAILGKETVRVFAEVFSRVDKRAQRERSGKTRVFKDSFGSGGDEDVKEGDEEKAIRMMRWKAWRKERLNSLMYVIPDAAGDAASFDPPQVDGALHPLSFDTTEVNAVSYPTSSAAADAASHIPSSDAAQGDAASYAASSNAAQDSVASYPPSFDASQTSAIPYPTSWDSTQASAIPHPNTSFDATQASAIPTSFTAAQADAAVQANPTAADYYGIPEDAKMILTRDDEQVDIVAEAIANVPITPKAMVVNDSKDIEMTDTESLPGPSSSGEAQISRSDKKEDGDIEMQ